MDNKSTAETVIASDVDITGNIKAGGSVHLHGKLQGDLDCAGDVVIGASADIKGNLVCSSASISGSVNGNITARDRIQLHGNARVHGDLKAKRLTVEESVTYVGRSEVSATP
jgi:cytoskeletal protein CcmA (bactofilin family)